jgi:transcriptional antiterminator RfaH
MPVLEREPDLFPPDLLDGTAPAAGRTWWVLHTRPRQEKSLARELYGRCVPFYLPLAPRRGVIRGRVVTSYVPLFQGYVFLRAEEVERLAALSTGRVVRALPVADGEGLRQDLERVRRLIASGSPLTLEAALTPGTWVEITSGALAGLRGRIRRSASGCRFVVEVDFIKQGASVEVDEAVLTRIEEPRSPGRGAPRPARQGSAAARENWPHPRPVDSRLPLVR